MPEQECDEEVWHLLMEKKAVPFAKNDEVRFLSGGKDITEEIFGEEAVDGVKILEPGSPARVIVYPSDLNQDHGGVVVVFHKGSWVKWCWDPRCGLTGDG